MLPPVSLPIAKPTKSRSCRRARSGARSRRRFLEQPRIHRLPAEPDVVERQRSQAELGHQHRSRFMQTLHDDGIFFGHAIAERLCAIGRSNSRRVEQILAAPRDAVQRSAIFARGNFFVRLSACSSAKSRVSVMTQCSLGSNCSRRFR